MNNCYRGSLSCQKWVICQNNYCQHRAENNENTNLPWVVFIQCTPTFPSLALITLSVPERYIYLLPARVTPEEVRMSCFSNPWTNFANSSFVTCKNTNISKLGNFLPRNIFKEVIKNRQKPTFVWISKHNNTVEIVPNTLWEMRQIPLQQPNLPSFKLRGVVKNLIFQCFNKSIVAFYDGALNPSL